jgi:hypothetical protein
MSCWLSRPSWKVRTWERALPELENDGAMNFAGPRYGQDFWSSVLILEVPFSHSATYSDSFQFAGRHLPLKRSGSLPSSQTSSCWEPMALHARGTVWSRVREPEILLAARLKPWLYLVLGNVP